MRFTKIPESTFQQLQLNAGAVVNNFSPTISTDDFLSAIVGATSGGVTFNAKPSYSDFGEDIDNCPVNVKELKHLDSWEVTLSGTFVTITATLGKKLIGAADIDGTDTTKILPRNDLDADTDFEDIWWVGDYASDHSDETGGYVAVHLINALSTDGLSIKSANRGKGNFDFTFTGHYSLEDQTVVPFEFYIVDTVSGA